MIYVLSKDGNPLMPTERYGKVRRMCEKHGAWVADAMRSRLTVKKSRRSYNNLSRVLPGAVFAFEGKRYVMTGQLSQGLYYRAYGEGTKNFPVSRCRILSVSGLVYA